MYVSNSERNKHFQTFGFCLNDGIYALVGMNSNLIPTFYTMQIRHENRCPSGFAIGRDSNGPPAHLQRIARLLILLLELILLNLCLLCSPTAKSDFLESRPIRGSRKFCQRESNFDNDL